MPNRKGYIDYDELAKAIVKAQKQADEEVENNESETISFFEAAKHIIRNDSNTNGNLMSNSLALFLQFAFNVIAILGTAITIILAVACICAFIKLSWQDANDIIANIIVITLSVVIIPFMLLMCMLFRGMANEIEKEKDRNYIVAIFSSLATFVAMVVGIIALTK